MPEKSYFCYVNHSPARMRKNNYHKNLMQSFFIALFLLPLTLLAQNPIPNPGFENWSGGEPDDWNSINQTILGTVFTPVTRDVTNPHDGTSCVKLETITQNVFIVGPVTLPGIISLGTITLDIVNQTGTVDGGIPVSGYPSVLHGWFRYLPAAGDSCIMGIGLSRWNGTSRDTIALSYLTIGGQNPDWQTFTVPIDYLITAEPDTMNILFFSSNLLTGSPVQGSVLWIDDLSVDFSAVYAENIANENNISIFQAESGRSIVLNTPDLQGGEFQLYSLNGSMLLRKTQSPGVFSRQIGLPSLSNGIYFARFISDSGQMQVQKIVVNH
ncbi:MAG: hypothetical protein FD170_913 [Bacteroidetes bacterium]|nr:MAG: hypothetical protein FD170_913 [Bacteroidota bacterium]